MMGELFIHLIWVAGTQMISQGTDGVSWGDLFNGVMSGWTMLQYTPMNLWESRLGHRTLTWFGEATGECELAWGTERMVPQGACLQQELHLVSTAFSS